MRKTIIVVKINSGFVDENIGKTWYDSTGDLI